MLRLPRGHWTPPGKWSWPLVPAAPGWLLAWQACGWGPSQQGAGIPRRPWQQLHTSVPQARPLGSLLASVRRAVALRAPPLSTPSLNPLLSPGRACAKGRAQGTIPRIYGAGARALAAVAGSSYLPGFLPETQLLGGPQTPAAVDHAHGHTRQLPQAFPSLPSAPLQTLTATPGCSCQVHTSPPPLLHSRCFWSRGDLAARSPHQLPWTMLSAP